jgi:hypothetical protein
MTQLIATSSVRYCRPCAKDVVTRPRVRFAGVGIGLVVLLTVLLIAFSALIGPFIMFMAPVILVAGFAIGPLMALATAPETCPECARELPFASRLEATRENERERIARRAQTNVAGRVAGTSGDMKAA